MEEGAQDNPYEASSPLLQTQAIRAAAANRLNVTSRVAVRLIRYLCHVF